MRNSSVVKNINTCLLIVFFTFLLLFAIELLLKVVGFGGEDPQTLAARYDKFKADKDLIWALKPGWRGFELNNQEVTTNQFGLRGDEYMPGTGYPLLMLGDSVLFGHYLPDEQTVADRLEAGIKLYTNPDITVLNGGVPGYSTFQQEGFYKKIGRELRPKLVLLCFCLNDVTERYVSVSEYGGLRFFMINVDTTSHLGFVRRIWQNSAIRGFLVWHLKKSAKNLETYRVENLWEDPGAEDIKAAWEVVFAELDKLREEIESDGVKFATVIFPYKKQLSDPKSDVPQEKLAGYLAGKNIQFLDLLPVFRSENFKPDQVFMDENHLTQLGAEMSAFHIHRFLIENKLIPVTAQGVM